MGSRIVAGSLEGRVGRTVVRAPRLGPVVAVVCAGLIGVPLWAAPGLAEETAAPGLAEETAAPGLAEETAAPASTPTSAASGTAPSTEGAAVAESAPAPSAAQAPPARAEVPPAASAATLPPAGLAVAPPPDAPPVAAGPVGPEPDKGVTRPDVSVVVSGPATGWAGGNGAYTITVTNAAAATAPASGFTVTYVAAAGHTVQSVNTPVDADWACALSTEASCTWFGELAAGESTPPVTVVVSHGRRAAGTMTATARVSAVDDEVHLADNARTVRTVMQAPTLSVNVGAPESVAAGAPVRVVLAVTNPGPGWASGFSVVGALPDGLQLSSLSGAGFDCDAALRSCAYTDVLAPGVTASVAVDGTIAPSYSGGPLVTTARLGQGGLTASATTAVTAPVVVAPGKQPVTQPAGRPASRPARVAPVPQQRPATTVAAPRRGSGPVAPTATRPSSTAATATAQPAGEAPAAAGAPATLPFTGSRADDGLTAGAGMLLVGLVLTVGARRRRTA